MKVKKERFPICLRDPTQKARAEDYRCLCSEQCYFFKKEEEKKRHAGMDGVGG